jgi:AcrR family transcriptional regulator
MKMKIDDERHHTEHGEAQKQRLVEAAFNIIAELGFEGLHTRNVAASVGISVSTFHFYFPSKDDLVQAVARKLLHDFRTQLNPGRRGGEGLNGLDDAIAAQTDLIRKNPSGYIVVAEIFNRALRDQKTRRVMRDILRTWERIFMASIFDGEGESQLAEGSDPALSARAMHCLFWGMAMNQLMNVRGYPSVAVFRQVKSWLSQKE